MKADDLEQLTTLGPPTISPDGRTAVVAASRADFGSDSYLGQLWSVPLTGGAPRRITRGRRDGGPQFSPDGTIIAFLRGVEKRGAQLHLVEAHGGEPVRITDVLGGVDDFSWSPDSSRIVFNSHLPEQGRYGTVEDIGADAEAPRRVSTLNYRQNGRGYTIDQRSQLFLVDVPDLQAEPFVPAVALADGTAASVIRPPESAFPSMRQLTTADADHSAPAFHPDGRSVRFIAALHETRDRDLRADVWELALEPDATPRRLTDPTQNLAAEAFASTSDGRLWLIAEETGDSGLDFVGRNGVLWMIPSLGGPAIPLSDDETMDLSDGGVQLSNEGGVLAINNTRGRAQLVRADADGELQIVTRDDIEVIGVDEASGITVVSFSTPASAGEVGVIRDGELVILTDFAAAARSTGILTPRELAVTGRDGYPIHGWLAVPPGEGPHPVLLMIHGGPFANYGVSLFDEAQVYAEAGYAVAYCNPRGSAGYGQAHGKAIRQRMGTVDLDDVLDFLDGAIAAEPSLDGERLGILGGSYGGYLTAWAIANDHRFAAAIVERGFLDPEQFVGTSDIGSFFGQEYVGTDPEQVRRQSPQARVAEVTTPTLLIHSEQDLRCPLGQAERYYAALKSQGTPAELLIFPGEDHELSRSGRPRHRVQRFDAILEWWHRHLPIEASR